MSGAKAEHEEVEAGERDHVDGELAQVGVELTWEAEARGDARHGGRDEVVQVTVGWGGELEGAEADVVQGLVVDAVSLVSVLDELVDGEGGVVRFDNGVRHLGRGNNREGVHDAVRVFLADLGDQECTHAGAGSAAEGVGELEALEAVAAFGLLADDVQDGVDELGALGVVALGPVVTGARLSEDKVVGAEDLSEWARSDRVHGTWFKVNEDGPRDVLAAGGFVVVHVDSLQLQVGVTVVGTGRVNTVFVGDDLKKNDGEGKEGGGRWEEEC